MDWVLVGVNICLVVVTGAYVILTKRMADSSDVAAKAAQDSAEAARDSAEAAKQAAESNREIAAATLASLEVDFKLDLKGMLDKTLIFEIENTGRSAVFVDAFELSYLRLSSFDEFEFSVDSTPEFETPLVDPEQAERLVHPNYSITCSVAVNVEEGPYGSQVSALGKVFYSVDRTRRDSHSVEVAYDSYP